MQAVADSGGPLGARFRWVYSVAVIELDDYHRHCDAYEAAGVQLALEALVGIDRVDLSPAGDQGRRGDRLSTRAPRPASTRLRDENDRPPAGGALARIGRFDGVELPGAPWPHSPGRLSARAVHELSALGAPLAFSPAGGHRSADAGSPRFRTIARTRNPTDRILIERRIRSGRKGAGDEGTTARQKHGRTGG